MYFSRPQIQFMKEDFLHHLWKYKKINNTSLQTTTDETIQIVAVGEHNLNSGPDFFNAKIKIDNQLWAGNVEIHVKSSDWYAHHHEKDDTYKNVILHVVWEDDVEVFIENKPLPTLELQNKIPENILTNYQNLFAKKQHFINCEKDITSVRDIDFQIWLERLYFERMEEKSTPILDLLETTQNDWEAVLFKLLAKGFGLKINQEAFLSIAESIDFSIVRNVQSNSLRLEALLLGQAKLLEENIPNTYYQSLQDEYQFLKAKYQIDNQYTTPVQFFRLRPANFPTIRLVQLAQLYYTHQNVFAKIIATRKIADFYTLFNIATSEFWETHYTFTKTSKKQKKKITPSFVDLLLINTIIPLKFCYATYNGEDVNEQILEFISSISPEKNSIVSHFKEIKVASTSAKDTQALLQLYNNYCTQNNCLNCVVGNQLLNR